MSGHTASWPPTFCALCCLPPLDKVEPTPIFDALAAERGWPLGGVE